MISFSIKRLQNGTRNNSNILIYIYIYIYICRDGGIGHYLNIRPQNEKGCVYIGGKVYFQLKIRIKKERRR
jgi:hypothetical protein